MIIIYHDLRIVITRVHLASFRVPMPPGKSWIFFLKIPGPGKSCKITLVLESLGN